MRNGTKILTLHKSTRPGHVIILNHCEPDLVPCLLEVNDLALGFLCKNWFELVI